MQAILDEEEVSFARTLDRGEKLFEQMARRAKEAGLKELSGKDVWRLYDTYGFPVDLTLIMAEEQGLGVNEAEFEKAQLASKEASKGGPKEKGEEMPKFDVHDLGALEKNDAVPKTDDSAKFGSGSVDATIKALYQDHKFVQSTEELDASKPIGILLDKTSLYAEQGGQQADTGSIVIDGQAEFVVEDCQVFNGYVLHSGFFSHGTLKVGDAVVASYDELRRWPLRNNHTGTHILNFALREILGDHIDQKGSLVAPTKLRFDFSHKQGVTVPELKKIEDICNEWVRKNVEVFSKEMSLETASKIPGLRAVFGESYPDPVRVVSLEFSLEEIEKDLENPKWRSTSLEFCGGTHVKKTGSIRDIVLVEESGIAKGIRRIVGVTGEEAAAVTRLADEHFAKVDTLDKIADRAAKDAAFKAYSVELGQLEISTVRKAELIEKFQAMRKKLDADIRAQAAADVKTVTDGVQAFFTTEEPNASVLVRRYAVGANAKALLGGTQAARKLAKSVYLFAEEVDATTGKTKVVHSNFVAPQDLERGLNAKEWAAVVSKVIGGKGGGKDDGASGVGEKGGPVLEEAIAEAKKFFKSKVSA